MGAMGVLRVGSVGVVLTIACASAAHGVSCPTGGAKVKVVVNNPTGATGQQITLSGAVVSGETTCTSASSSYNRVVNLYTTGDNEFVVPFPSGGLNSGVWVHHISTNVGGNQHQQKPVTFTSVVGEYTTVSWTYHPTVINVNVAGDSVGTCTTSCSFRQALNKANGLAGAAPAILIQFALSTPTLITMTNSADLLVGVTGHSPIITIDGTDSNGNPWIVGDGFAAAQGSQDSFPRTIDLNNVTKFNIQGHNVTIKGLEIKNTVSSGNPTKRLIESSRNNVRLEALRLDGGKTGVCSPTDCSNAIQHLTSLAGSGSQIINVEGRSAYGSGAEFPAGSHQVRDSWFHHNYIHSIEAFGTTLSRNLLELGGRRAADNAQVYDNSAGIFTLNTGGVTTSRNLVRNHTAHSVDGVIAVSNLTLAHDYYCGNAFEGVMLRGAGVGTVTATGVASAYNNDYGIELENSILSGSGLTFNNHNAFTANNDCGIHNSSTVMANADNNQWRNKLSGTCSGSPDRCTTGGTVTCDNVQDYINMQVTLDVAEPAFPSNLILKGQTLRVQGSGFNAIHGNPVADSICAIGNADVSNENCCRKSSKANLCGTITPPDPPPPLTNAGNCVALRDAVST